MKRILAIARLTMWEGVRMRIVLVFIVVLVFLVLRLPFALRGDETLAGRLQNFLSYSLGALGLFLSLATVFLSCSTLTNEIKTCSLHLVVTKPVSRFEILLGKWFGVNLLNLLLVLLCGVAIYGFARFIERQPEVFRRDRLKVRDVVLTARAAATPVKPTREIRDAARRYVRQKIKEGAIPPEKEQAAVEERMRVGENLWLSIRPGEYRVYRFENLSAPEREDTVVQVRFKARGVPIPPREMLPIGWLFLDPQTDRWLMPEPLTTEERSGDTHEFLAAAEPVIEDGRAALMVLNPWGPGRRSAIQFNDADSLQILYKVGSFEWNFAKSLFLVLLRLAFLSAVGLFFGTFTSFPVASLCTMTVYLVGLGHPFLMEAIGANMEVRTDAIDPYGSWGPAVRFFLVPFLNYAFPNLSRYDGSALLVDGTAISGWLLAECGLRTLAVGALLVCLFGWLVFWRREIADISV